jgi:hypothetical protein
VQSFNKSSDINKRSNIQFSVYWGKKASFSDVICWSGVGGEVFHNFMNRKVSINICKADPTGISYDVADNIVSLKRVTSVTAKKYNLVSYIFGRSPRIKLSL